jgi:hypothetical protein
LFEFFHSRERKKERKKIEATPKKKAMLDEVNERRKNEKPKYTPVWELRTSPPPEFQFTEESSQF